MCLRHRVLVQITSAGQCWRDGCQNKLWDSFHFQQDLELEAATWTGGHLQTLARLYDICTYKVVALHATSTSNRKKNFNFHPAELGFVILKQSHELLSVWCSFLLLFGYIVCLSVTFLKRLNCSFWNKSVDVHLLHWMCLVIHKLAMRLQLTHKRAICSTIITSATTSLNKTIRPSVVWCHPTSCFISFPKTLTASQKQPEVHLSEAFQKTFQGSPLS